MKNSNKSAHFREKLKQALNSTFKVISDDFRIDKDNNSEKEVEEDKAVEDPSLNPEEIAAIDSGDVPETNSSKEKSQELDKAVGDKKNKN